jgi:hypothetical protein
MRAIVVALSIIALVVGLAWAANPGLQAGTVWMGTEAGNCDSTTTDTRTAPMTVLSIVFHAAADTDTCLFTDGSTVETMLSFRNSAVVEFGSGKVFRKGLYLKAITSGAKVYVYPK